MGRLENFIPLLKHHHVQETSGKTFLAFEKGRSIACSPNLVPFIKQMNGTLSLKEIFLFLNTKGEFFSVNQSLQFLRELSQLKLLQNAEDFIKMVDEPAGKNARNPNLAKVERSYFSEERLIGLLQKTTLFLKCDRPAALKILKESSLEHVKEGEQLIKAGSKSNSFYVLLTGEVGVLRNGQLLAHLGPLSVFGESAAIFNKVRNADVVATEPSWILRVNAANIVDTKSAERFEAYKGLRSRLILNQTLAANPLFRGLPTDVLQFFISKCRIEKYGSEHTVIEQDETSGDFYFILQGSVLVVKDGIPVTSLAEGDHFGEVAAMFNEPRTASILTETACTFLVLSQNSLFTVLCGHFRLAIDIENTAIARRNSKGNVLQIFEDDFVTDENEPTSGIDELTISELEIDDDFIEASQSNFDLGIIDFSNPEDKAS